VHAQAIRELVARDKNHPSVVLWSIANEPESDTEGAENYFKPLFELTKELDPSRPVAFVNVMLAHTPAQSSRVGPSASLAQDRLMLRHPEGRCTPQGTTTSLPVALPASMSA
jgi:beta-galactosidase/beta-glucuronidase